MRTTRFNPLRDTLTSIKAAESCVKRAEPADTQGLSEKPTASPFAIHYGPKSGCPARGELALVPLTGSLTFISLREHLTSVGIKIMVEVKCK